MQGKGNSLLPIVGWGEGPPTFARYCNKLIIYSLYNHPEVFWKLATLQGSTPNYSILYSTPHATLYSTFYSPLYSIHLALLVDSISTPHALFPALLNTLRQNLFHTPHYVYFIFFPTLYHISSPRSTPHSAPWSTPSLLHTLIHTLVHALLHAPLQALLQNLLDLYSTP